MSHNTSAERSLSSPCTVLMTDARHTASDVHLPGNMLAIAKYSGTVLTHVKITSALALDQSLKKSLYRAMGLVSWLLGFGMSLTKTSLKVGW